MAMTTAALNYLAYKHTSVGQHIGGKIKNAVYSVAQKACRFKFPKYRKGFSGERHIPCHNYCGPGTHFTTRQARGDKGVNALDTCFMAHDRAYANTNPTVAGIRNADKRLMACAKRAGGNVSWALRKVFQGKFALEDKGYLDPARFATHLKKVRGK